MSFEITDASRKSAPLSVYIEGESGSGKTYSALLLARGLVGPTGRIGVIDTEGNRSLIYADDPLIGGFRHINFDAPYSPDRMIEGLKAAIADKWDAIVLDSASLEHDGEGGLLDMAENEADSLASKNPNNRAISQQKWTRPKLAHKRFLNFAVGLPSHVIFCFRQTLTTDFNAKPPVTIKTAVAEKNTKFSLEMHCLIDAEHRAHWSRVPKPYLGCIKNASPITIEMGQMLASEAGNGETPRKATGDSDSIAQIEASMKIDGIDDGELTEAMIRLTAEDFTTWQEMPPKYIKGLLKPEGWAKAKAKAFEVREETEGFNQEN
jgi:hypothetical protein